MPSRPWPERLRIAHAVNAPPQHLAELRDEVIAALALVDDHPEKTWSGLPPVGQPSRRTAWKPTDMWTLGPTG